MAETPRAENSPASESPRLPQRLFRNKGGYFGERIDIAEVLKDCHEAARAHGWATDSISGGHHELLVLSRSAVASAGNPPRVYISTGIHGDEPAGPIAVRRLLCENLLPAGIEYRVLPCLNPSGFQAGTRENAEGIDLNRDYLSPRSAEVKAHVAWIEAQSPFHLCLCLHEDWEAHGFYIYELNPDREPSLADAMVRNVLELCPIDYSEVIEGRAALNGIIRPDLDPRSRPLWPESFYLITHKTRHSYTLEAPSDFALETRASALVAAVLAALRGLVSSGIKS